MLTRALARATGLAARRWLSTGGQELQTRLRPIIAELERKDLFATAHANESEGAPVEVFACTLPAAGLRAALMGDGPHWDRSSGNPSWVAGVVPREFCELDEPHPESFLTVSESLDVAEVAERWGGEADDGENDGCSEEDARALHEAVGLLNEEASAADGTCFEFARPCLASGDESVYTVGAGCVCEGGILVGWRQDNVVWT